MMTIANDLLSADDLAHLTAVIGEAERTTSGEIKLIIARRSTRATHVAPTLWLTLTSVALLALWLERERFIDAPFWLMPAVLIGSAVVAGVLARVPYVQRWLTPKHERRVAANLRAELEFHREGLSLTKDRTGILLFLSLLEREAVVLADRGIAARVDAGTWRGVLDLILAGAASDQPRAKLEEAIRLCGRLLTDQFPAAAGDADEITNAVVVKD